MANPNLGSFTNLFGITFSNILTTSNVAQVTNASGSGNVYKIETIMVSNNDSSNSANCSVEINENASGTGDRYRLSPNISVPPNSTLVVVYKESSLFLNEDRTIKASSHLENALEITISYQDIS